MKYVLFPVLVSVIIFFLIALGLTFSQSPKTTANSEEALDFASALNADYSTLRELQTHTARDGTSLYYRPYRAQGESDTLFILLHGSGWHGMQFHEMAEYLSLNGIGHVIVPDLRGHGFKTGRRGDVDHIGQFEEDIADLIAHVKGEFGQEKRIVIGGHSSGGGLTVRFAGGEYGELADGFILMAPFLKYNAPTTKPNSGGWASVATRRMIGLSMLNMAGVKAFNHLPVIAFNMPQSILNSELGKTATTQYTYRLNTSFAPRSDYEHDLAAMRQPFLLLAGTEDESFRSALYEEVISAHTDSGTYKVFEGVNHIGIVNAPKAFLAISEWSAGIAGK